VASSKDLSDLKKSVEKTHGEMKRLNRLIAENKDLQAKLASTTVVMEKEFKAELREMEMESIRMDRKNEELKREHEQILEDIMETERQVLLWEKKIKLEKETQKALDPEVGMAEARSMENEIHRMTLRYNALKREQENMLKEIEMAIQKREAIAIRNRGKKKSTTMSKCAVKAEIRELDKTHRTNHKKTKKCQSEIEKSSQELKTLQSNMNEKNAEQQKLEKVVHEIQQDMNERLYMKQKIVDSTALLKQMRDEYLTILKQDDDEDNDDIISISKRKEAESKDSLESRREEILELIETLKTEFPQFKEVLSRVGGMSNQALPI
jgi:chromosome segregation ATPase